MTDKAKTLEMIAEAYRTKAAKIDRRVVVCVDTGCIANGSLDVLKAITEACKAAKLNVVVEMSKLRSKSPQCISACCLYYFFSHICLLSKK